MNKWREHKETNVNGEYLTYLRFADYYSPKHRMNYKKMKLIFNIEVKPQAIMIKGQTIERIEGYKYLR